ncbi:MAG: thioredoxin [Clostridiales Family XIII bacterium]|jgi:thioredoxin 1|nr:thioredoxin [Clostridiales Family XIII bacterium]
MSEIKIITADEFEAAIASGVVVVDFYADWCGPCKMMAPIFEEAQDAFEGKAVFVKVNVDANRELSTENKIMSIPTLLFYKDGVLAERVSGVLDKPTLEGKLNALI